MEQYLEDYDIIKYLNKTKDLIDEAIPKYANASAEEKDDILDGILESIDDSIGVDDIDSLSDAIHVIVNSLNQSTTSKETIEELTKIYAKALLYEKKHMLCRIDKIDKTIQMLQKEGYLKI